KRVIRQTIARPQGGKGQPRHCYCTQCFAAAGIATTRIGRREGRSESTHGYSSRSKPADRNRSRKEVETDMKYHNPLKQIQSKTRPYWDRNETRPAVRWTFAKALQCRTPELGAEVYGLKGHELILDHTCKSRTCSSCGYRATV